MIQTQHFKDMLSERNIRIEWVDETLEKPDKTEEHEDGTVHFLKKVQDRDNRWLRVIVNNTSLPKKLITAFFDRRLKRKYNES